MKLINFYKNIWSKTVTNRDRLLFALILLLFSCIYFYSLFFVKKEGWNAHLPEIVLSYTFILLLVIKPVGEFIIRTWLCVSGTIGQIVFFIILFWVFYLILSPIYMLVNLAKKKKPMGSSNWSINPHQNNNYKTPG